MAALIAPAPVARVTHHRLTCRRRYRRSTSNLGRPGPFSAYPTEYLLRTRRSVQVPFATPPNKQVDSPDDGYNFQEDLGYLGKLGAGSVGGAAVIKYGSIIFPQITQPNILQALVMISTPVIIAVFLLIKQSRQVD